MTSKGVPDPELIQILRLSWDSGWALIQDRGNMKITDYYITANDAAQSLTRLARKTVTA